VEHALQRKDVCGCVVFVAGFACRSELSLVLVLAIVFVFVFVLVCEEFACGACSRVPASSGFSS
jgi:hypothetical protein